MFGCIPFSFFKFWEILNNSLHVLNGAKLRLTFLVLQESLNQFMNWVRNITKIFEHNFFEKLVIVTGENNFFHFFFKVR